MADWADWADWAAVISPRRTGLAAYILCINGGRGNPSVLVRQLAYDDGVAMAVVAYIGRNWELFERHFTCTDGSFDDGDLFDGLAVRGAYVGR